MNPVEHLVRDWVHVILNREPLLANAANLSAKQIRSLWSCSDHLQRVPACFASDAHVPFMSRSCPERTRSVKAIKRGFTYGPNSLRTCRVAEWLTSCTGLLCLW